MSTKSKIEKLPEEKRQFVDALLASPQLTLDQVLEQVRATGIDASRTGLHRRQKDLATVAERIRRSKDVAEVLAAKFEDADDDKLARLNNQVLNSAILEILMEADEEGSPVTLDSKQVMALSKSLNELSRARKTDADRMVKVRAEIADKTITAAVDEVKKVAPGLDKNQVDKLREAISGKVLGQ